MSAPFAPGRLRQSVIGWSMLAVPLVLIAVLVHGSGRPLAERTLISFFLDAVLVVGMQMFIGNSGIISFGHVAFMGVGAYTAALATIPPDIKVQQLPDAPGWLADLQLTLPVSVVLGALMAAVIALLVGGALVRMRESAMAMGTLALLVFGYSAFSNWSSLTRGTIGLYGIPNNSTVWVTLFALLGVLLLARLYRSSRPGMRLQASREDAVAAAASGVNVRMERLGSWVLSAAVMGAGGALWAQSYLAFGPDAFYFDITFALLAMLVIGGRASVTGAVAGAAIITIATDMLTRVEQGFPLGAIRIPAVPGLVRFSIALLIILALVFRPQGLFGRWELDDVVRRIRTRARGRRERRAAPPEISAEPVAADEGAAVTPATAATAPQQRNGQRPPGPAEEEEGAAAMVLSAEGISKSFEGLHALSEVSLAVGQGNVLGLIGPNGSGKTTLLNVLSGIFPPDAGRVRLLGKDVGGSTPHHIARAGLARTFQNIRLFPELTVREHIEVAAIHPESPEVHDVISWLGLEPVLEELGGNLAYGVQRRVEIARAAVRHPSLLLLDEPAAGMNEAESDDLLGDILAIRDRLGCSVVVVDHDLRLIMQLCERIHVLNEGRTVAEGEPREVATDPAVVEAYLGRPRTDEPSTDDPVEG